MSGPLDRTVMWLTWRQLFARRRIWFAVAFALAPLLFTLIFKVVADDGEGSAARLNFFSGLGRDIVLGTLLPLVAVIFGTTAFGGEIDDGTLVYLLVKPIARWKIALSKLTVAVLSTFAVVVPAVMLPWLVLRGTDVPGQVPVALLAGGAIASLIYSAIFLLLGLVTKRALVAGLMYVISFEDVLSRGLVGLKSFSVREYAATVAQAVSNGTLAKPAYLVPMSTVQWMAPLIVVGTTVWMMRKLSRYELAERL